MSTYAMSAFTVQHSMMSSNAVCMLHSTAGQVHAGVAPVGLWAEPHFFVLLQQQSPYLS